MQTKMNEIISKGESISIEFKRCRNELPKSIFETICSFLNRIGGDIFLGVDDNKKIVGIEKSEMSKIKINLVSALNNSNKIFPTVYLSINEVEIDGKWILHIFVPESSQVHHSNGRIYDRNEDGDFDITNNTDMIAQMYIRKQREYTENTIYPFASTADLIPSLIDRVRLMAVNRQPHHPWEKLTNEELLKSAGLYQKNMQTGQSGYTLACILLFGTDEAIRSALPHHKTDAILRRVNMDRYDDRDDIRCNLIESYDRLMSFVEKHLNDMFYLEGDTRVSVRNKLFREVVANILIHREFSSAYPAKFIIGANEVTTENSNKAHGSGVMDLNNFIPYPKNPVIAGVFKEIGWAEELGSGIRNVKHYAKIYSESIPVFIEGDIFKTIIRLDNPIKESAAKIGGKNRRQKSAAKIGGKNCDAIIAYLEHNPNAQTAAIAENIGLSASRTRDYIKILIAKDVLEFEGRSRARIYRLKVKD